MSRKGGKWCSAPNCTNNSKSNLKKLSFFRFPKCPDRCKKWVQNCRRQDFMSRDSTYLYNNCVLCSEHFEPILFLNYEKTRLHEWAVPTIFNVPNPPSRISTKRKLPTKHDVDSSRSKRSKSRIPAPDPMPCSSTAIDNPPQTSSKRKLPTEHDIESSETKQLKSHVPVPDPIPSSSTTPDDPNTNSNVFEKQNFENSAAEPVSSNVSPISPVPLSISPILQTSDVFVIPLTSEECLQLSGKSPLSKNRDIACQTEDALSYATPRKRYLRKTNRVLKRSVSYFRSKLFEQDVKQKSSEKKKKKIELFNKLCDELLPQKFSEIVKTNAQLNVSKSPKARRYTMEFKKFALNLYYVGPKAYRFLSSTMLLPKAKTLRNLTKNWKFSSGINENVFSVLQKKVASLPPERRSCILCADEISLKSNLHYDAANDSIIGLHDLGNGKSFRIATHALTFMVSGILDKWKQPISYYFVNSSCSAYDLKSILFELLDKLFEIDLTVKCFITDMGSNFVQLSKILGVTTLDPHFFFKENKIIYMFDPPHLMKSLRNNLIKYKFVFNNKEASWSDVKSFYECDSKMPLKLAPKLTEIHISPNGFQKMRVKLATQVLSATVAASLLTYVSHGKLPAKAAGTAEFISQTDKLFDVFNSSALKSTKKFKRPFAGQDFQVQFCFDMLKFFDSLKLIDHQGNDVTAKVKFIHGFNVSIRGLLDFYSDIKKEGFSFLLTRRLSQDCLENFFSLIRSQGGYCSNPTPKQFCFAFKKLLCLNFFQMSVNSNCAEDYNAILSAVNKEDFNILKLHEPSKPISVLRGDKSVLNSLLKININDFKNLELPYQNAIHYVAGYLLKRCHSLHTCEKCSNLSANNCELSSSSYFSHFKAYEGGPNPSVFGSLETPSDEFLFYIEKLEDEFIKNFGNSCDSPAELLTTIFKEIVFSFPCDNFPASFLLNLFIRLRIFSSFKDINKSLKKSNCGKENKRKLLNLKHF